MPHDALRKQTNILRVNELFCARSVSKGEQFKSLLHEHFMGNLAVDTDLGEGQWQSWCL
jgi:hypothetical protein